MRRNLNSIHNHVKLSLAVIRCRIEGSFIFKTQQVLVFWQLYLVISEQEYGLKENGFDRE